MVTAFIRGRPADLGQYFPDLHEQVVFMIERTTDVSRWLGEETARTVIGELLKETLINAEFRPQERTTLSEIYTGLARIVCLDLNDYLLDVPRGSWKFEKNPKCTLKVKPRENRDSETKDVKVLTLHRFLDEWERTNRRASSMLEAYYFGGYTFEETAEIFGTSLSFAVRTIKHGEAFLREKFGAANLG
ncbi:MAG: ECF-type sigma factor [Acidobacteriota bacterium]|nr:ECF-type sigma factor [Acidobacteriota bacterium]